MAASSKGRQSSYYDVDNDDDKSCFCRWCCVWLTFFVCFILLTGFIVGAVYYAFLQSTLPEAHLHRLDILKLNITHNSKNEAFLTSDLLFYLNVTNRSERLKLVYGLMTASISSMGVTFPNVRIDAMHQDAYNQTDLMVQSTSKKAVEESAGKQLIDAANSHLMVINFIVRGWMDIYLDDKKLQGFPYKIDCHSIDQMDIDKGFAPACNAKISLLQ